MKIKLLLLLMLVLVTSLVTAEYPYTGYQGYTNDDSILEVGDTLVLTGSELLTDAFYSPLAYDIDKNGIDEIIILDDTDIKIYQADPLTLIETISLNDSFSYSPPYITDWDSDGDTDILIGKEASGGENYYIYSYNGSAFELESANNISVSEYMVTQCDTDGCLIVGFPASSEIQISWITSSGEIDTYTQPSNVASGNCQAEYPFNIGYDGESYYLTQCCGFAGTYRCSLYKYAVISDTITLLNSYTENTDDAGDYFTSAVADYNLNGNSGDGAEVVIGYFEASEDQFKVYVFDEDLNKDDTLGSLFSVPTSDIISNPTIGSVYPDSIGKDYCVAGYYEGDSSIHILCGSLTSSYENIELIYPLPYNLTFVNSNVVPPVYDNMIHLSDQRPSLDGDEFITPIGIFGFDYDTNCFGFPDTDCNLQSLFYSTTEDKAIIMNDKTGSGYADLIQLKSNSIRYFSRIYTNDPAEIDDWQINPCLDQGSLKLNTTVRVIFDAVDDYDLVQSRVFLYYGTTYEVLSNWTSWTSSNTSMQHTFDDQELNRTTTSAILRIEARDEANNDTIDFKEFSYSVSNTGIEYGDCIQSGSETTEEEAEEEAVTGAVTESDNVITDAVDTAEEEFGVPAILLFIIFMIIIIYNIWVSPITESNPQVTFGIIFLVTALMLIFGVKLGIISPGFLLTLIIIGMIPTGIWIGKKIIGHGGD